MDRPHPRIIDGARSGVKHLDPMPTEAELAAFYARDYYEGFAASDRRLNQDPDNLEELRWQKQVVHGDLIATLRDLGCGSRILDIGCGLGELVESLTEAGFSATGIEPSHLAVKHARDLGRTVDQGDLGKLSAQPDLANTWDAVVLINVLEHIPQPETVLEQAGRLLKSGGLVVVRVPNDFSEIQDQARKALDSSPWWVAIPDHVNYFSPEGLEKTLEASGFSPVARLVDFPMELFLLMGDNYIGNTEQGKSCHRRRRRLELSMGSELRRKFLGAMAAVGMGRNITIIAAKT
jgi:SAM-dependent methyltransferase